MKENNQSLLSKKWIIDSLLYLLKTKPYSEITITEITKKAGVARLTFYRNFESKDQILITRSNYLFQEYLDEIRQNGKITSIQQALLQCFNNWQRDSQVMELLIKNDLIYLIEQPFYTFLEKIIEEIPDLDNLDNTQKIFVLGGVTRTILDWISTKSTKSSTEITESILTLIDLRYLVNSSKNDD